MPLRKLADPKRPCRSPQHKLPGSMVYKPGRYEWTCPVCVRRTVFRAAG
jgi:hypothetical protein